ncbi:MAG: response regulator [Rhodoferax sp.]|nr:response regulator [Rhodoferax sp.]
MEQWEQALHARLVEGFLVEARELLSAISTSVLELEHNSDAARTQTLVETAFRAAHSLKGGARIVNFTLIETLCQSLENCLSAARHGNLPFGKALVDLSIDTTDIVEKILASSTPQAPSESLQSAAKGLCHRLEALLGSTRTQEDTPPATPAVVPDEAQEPSVPSAADPQVRAGPVETVRIPAARLDELLLQAEEMIALKLTLRQHVVRLKEISSCVAQIRHDHALSMVSGKEAQHELDRSLGQLAKQVGLLRHSSEEDARLAAGKIESFINSTKALLMFPFSSITEGLSRLVHDLAREQHKEVVLRLTGETLELDRRILQSLKSPLIHLVRNCIDHGVEVPAERNAVGKPAQAHIDINVSSIGNGKVKILVRDDGRGIDTARVIASATREGIISAEDAQKMGDEEAKSLIFRSGVSSAATVTTISGRGLGMAIVAEQVENLGGSIQVDSQTGAGSRFELVIPTALASFRGIQVQVGDRFFALPTMGVRKVGLVAESDIKTVGNRETVVVDGQTIPLVSLAAILGIPTHASGIAGKRTIIVLGSGVECVAFELDKVIGEDDMLVKGLGSQLVRVRNISGATVLGNGTVVPILNVMDLLFSSGGSHANQPIRISAEASAAENVARRVLVVDDSITSRTLLKNVLESYGYVVATASDGANAMAMLQAEAFDLVSSDVEMPNVDGFELTARIRADARLNRIPVVLVTSLESAADKQKGIEAGADAYIVKSSFDQGNLLAIISKLI